MNKRIYILFSLLIVMSPLFAQENSDYYRLEKYYFYPEKKLIEVNDYYEEDEYVEYQGKRERIHKFGYKNFPTDINYDSTTLYFLAGGMFFSEDLKREKLPPPGDEIVIQSLDNFAYITKDKDSPFIVYDLKKADFTDMKEISKCLYQHKDGRFYALANYVYREITNQEYFPEISISTLKYIAPGFYSGKDGLYHILGIPNWKSVQITKLQDGNRKTDKIKVTPYYIVYNNTVYGIFGWNTSEKKELNPEKIKVFDFGKRFSYPILTDGEKTYHGGHSIENYADGVPQLISETRNFQRKDDTLFWGCKKIPNAIDVKFSIFASEDDKLNLHTAYKTVMIYNHKIKDYEPFELDKYRFITGDFYVYKEILYGKDSYPIYEQDKINTEKLTFVTRELRTNFYQDGNVLIYINSDEKDYSQKEFSYTDNGELILGNNLVKGADFKSLKIGTMNILIDKNNIYSGVDGDLTIIPLDKIGIKIKAFAD